METSDRHLVVIRGHEVAEGTNTLDGLIASFLVVQDIKKASAETYKRELLQFFQWVGDSGLDMGALSRVDILDFKDHLLERGLSPLTVSNYIEVVRKFFEWSESMKYYPNIAKGVKGPRREQKFKKLHLSEEQSRALLGFFQSSVSETAPRDFAVVNLILRTGLRCIEVTRADISDITFRGGRRILKVFGKGRDEKSDFVILSEKAYQPIRDYLQTDRVGALQGEPLFVSFSNNSKGRRLSTRTVSGICKEGLKAIGLDGREFTAHSLRHTTAVQLLKHGGQLADVQAVLRHANPATTQIYTESVKEELRVEKAPELLLDDVF